MFHNYFEKLVVKRLSMTLRSVYIPHRKHIEYIDLWSL